MLNSNPRKLMLSGWLKEHDANAYSKTLKLQKFLFLYEAFVKAHGERPDFDYLQGWKRGPVFSKVWGDYTYEREMFDREAASQYAKNKDNFDESMAQRSSFIVSTLTERELSDLTHCFNIWNVQAERIQNGEQKVALSENDFSESDIELVKKLEEMYPNDLIEESFVVSIDQKNFVFLKKDIELLSVQHYDVLSTLSEDDSLHNPVFVTIEEEGRLIVD